MTRCRDKRSIVRALNNFSDQYDFIYCGQKEVNLAIEPIEFYYGDEAATFLFGISPAIKNQATGVCLEGSYQNIIYSRIEEKINLYDTNFILKAIDNMISINRQKNIKDVLKEVVQSREVNGINHFFKNESIAIKSISLALDDEKYNDAFIKKLFSQIKNRIKYWRSGIYTNNDKPSNITAQKVIKAVPTSLLEIIYEQINFLMTNISILSFETKEDVKQARMVYERDSKHPEFDSTYTDFERNSSLFHPINEFDDEPDLKQCARESNMPLPLLYRERDGIYNEEDWNTYYEYEDFEIIRDELVEIMDELISYVNQKNTLHTEIYKVFNDDEIKEFKDYEDHKTTVSKDYFKIYRSDLIKLLYTKNKKRILLKKVSLLQNYFLCEDVTSKLKRYHKDLDTYGFVFSEEEFLEAYRIQKELFNACKCHSLEDYQYEFDEEGIIDNLFNWYDEYDIVKSYWFDVSKYSCYDNLLSEDFYEEEYDEIEKNLSINVVNEEEVMEKYGYTELILSEEEQEMEAIKIKKSTKLRPPIPF